MGAAARGPVSSRRGPGTFPRSKRGPVDVFAPADRRGLAGRIQRILGHAQVSTTCIYTDPTDPLTREAVDRIGRMLWPDGAGPMPQNRNQKRNPEQ